MAYLVGRREFYSLDFEVTPDVLIPRPETELLVVALLDQVKGQGTGGRGQGSNGDFRSAVQVRNRQPPSKLPTLEPAAAFAICAAKYVPHAQVTAIDISPAALAVAKRNATKHGVAERIDFIESNLFANVPADKRFDFIVSNPPYVSTAEMADLPADVRDHEPRVALEAGEQGTDVIAPLVEQAAERLLPGGALIIEVSPMIADRVEQIVRDNGQFELGTTIRDLAGMLASCKRRDRIAEILSEVRISMSFFTVLTFYRPGRPPTVTGESCCLVRQIVDTGSVEDLSQASLKVRFGEAIDSDNKAYISTRWLCRVLPCRTRLNGTLLELIQRSRWNCRVIVRRRATNLSSVSVSRPACRSRVFPHHTSGQVW